jgi:hypothetical protein
MREVPRADFVGANRDGNRAHIGEIRLADGAGLGPYGVLTVGAAGEGRYDVR